MDLVAGIREQYPLVETLVIAALILLVTWVAERQVFKLVNRLGVREANPVAASSIFANIARVCIWLLGVAAVCRICFDYDISAFITALGVGGIAISLGLQDTLSNLIGGLQVSLGKIVSPGDYVEVLGQSGKVTDIGWRHSTIVDGAGFEHRIPNSLINKNSLVDIGEYNDVRVPFVVPLATHMDDFTTAVVEKVGAGMGDALGPKGVRVYFSGQQAEGLHGSFAVQVRRERMGGEGAADAVMRLVDPILKQAGSCSTR